MEAIEVLMQEHRTIEQVLDAAEAFADALVRSRRTEKDALSRYVRFLREFADARHHAKEEGVLFRAMVEHGFPRDGGPIPVMLHEHDQGRALVGGLAAHAEQEPPWSDEDLGAIAGAARQLAALLRAHIQKEDRILYPMAERHLSDDAAREVTEACRRLDAAHGPPAQDPLIALGELIIAGQAAHVASLRVA